VPDAYNREVKETGLLPVAEGHHLWSTQAAKVGHLVTDLMGFDLDELNRYAAGISIRLLRDYCDRLERLLESTGGLQVIDGGRRQ
jgi:hypothetical protein